MGSSERERYTWTLALCVAGLLIVPNALAGERGVASPAPLQEWRHAAGEFTLRFPRTWCVLRDIHDGEPVDCFTPETTADRVDEVDRGLFVFVFSRDPRSMVAGRDCLATFRQMLPLIRQGDPGMAPVGDVALGTAGGLLAAIQDFQGVLAGRDGTFRSRLYLATKGDVVFGLISRAPAEEYERLAPVFERIIRESELGRRHPSRRGTPFQPYEITQAGMESVVGISNAFASGSGVIVHENG
jgi:hypothetical protein